MTPQYVFVEITRILYDFGPQNNLRESCMMGETAMGGGRKWLVVGLRKRERERVKRRGIQKKFFIFSICIGKNALTPPLNLSVMAITPPEFLFWLIYSMNFIHMPN